MTTSAENLRELLAQDHCHIMPCCYDGLTANLIEQAGFPLTFMSGFAVSAARLGLPDTGLISYGEMLDQGLNICSAVSIPVIGDGDTGYGNAMNVRRTVEGYARAGFSAVMIEDQVSPKRCGHTKGKLVVSREEACERIRAAVDVREEGSDILFVEAPRTVEEMQAICTRAPGIHMANIIEGGKTPVLSPEDLQDLGFRIAAYPLALISAAMQAIADALKDLKTGIYPSKIMDFSEIRKQVGFEDYYTMEKRYGTSSREDV